MEKSLHVTVLSFDRLMDAGYNARKIDAEGMKRLKRSLDEFGLVEPLVVNDRGAARWKGDKRLVIVSGHQRMRVMRESGARTAPCVVVALPPAKEKALVLRLNRHDGVWDEVGLAGLMRDVDADLAGFNLDEVTELMDNAAVEDMERTAMSDEDDTPAPEEGVVPDSKPGEVYELGPHRLICGDSTVPETYERLLRNEPAAMVFTDPPYNIDYNPRTAGRGTQKKPNRDLGGIIADEMNKADFCAFMRAMVMCIRHVLADGGVGYFCMGQTYYHHLVAALEAEGWKHAQMIVWVKQSHTMTFADYSPATEIIGVAQKGGHKRRNVRTIRSGGAVAYAWPQGDRHRWFGDAGQGNVWWLVDREDVSRYQHPTQKPVALPLRAILNSSQAGESVLDPFAGSGTTMIAAEKAGRKARLVEIDPKWCDVIRRRWMKYSTGSDADWTKKARKKK